MKVFVTGAEGFIGSHLVEALVRSGHDVRALVQYNSFNSKGWLDSMAPEMRGQIEVIAGDVRDRSQMSHCVQGCDAVFHLAALIAIPYSYAAPQSYVDTNITGTLNILEAVRANHNARMIHTSTSEVYALHNLFQLLRITLFRGRARTQLARLRQTNLHFPIIPLSICP